METTARDAFIGRIVDGRYRIEARLARGGMATVYRATDLRLDRVVALKIMHASLAEDPGFVARFEREARSAAKLSHPHLVSVFDQGTDGLLVYLVMEYVTGRTVRDVLREHGPLLPARALAILDPVLEALAAAHRAGIVHRDVKPENVMISDEGTVKVTDFGLARAIATSSSTTTHGVLIGTVAYLSPEQVEGGYADTRSDVYGAGILLFELLTGAVPFAGETPLSVAYQHVHGAVPPPSSLRPNVAPQIDELVAVATSRDPNDRYGDADDFLSALRDVSSQLPGSGVVATAPTRAIELDTQPVKVRPPGVRPPGPTSRRRAKRRRGQIALLLLVVLATILGIGTYILGRHHSVAVPSVLSESVTAATATLHLAGLKLDASQSGFSETYSAGQIMSTDPVPGAPAPVGGTVRAVVSKGPQRFTVPNVADIPPAQASAALTTASLLVGNTTLVYDDHVPIGHVARTSPAIGTAQRAGTPVDLLVSKGPLPVKVPQLLGRTQAAATAALTAAGLTAQVTLAYSDTVTKSLVISANPGPGQTVGHGSSVTLVISKGPPPVTVPYVVGEKASVAIAQLQALGLKVTVTTVGTGTLHIVQTQSIGANAIVPKFTVINLGVV